MVLQVPLQAEKLRLLPDAPIKQFRLPVFDETGYKVCDFAGEEGKLISETEVLVSGMVLRTWEPGDPPVLSMTIQSPTAVILPSEQKAVGKEFIAIRSADGNFSILGRQWFWEGRENRIVIEEDVRVSFNESLGGLLNY